jgi:hypothetical protein
MVWETLKNCRLVATGIGTATLSCDVRRNEFVFRLYFVDAPETGGDRPTELGEQQSISA